MALSQVQIIRSLAEALAWFEKELSWNVPPAELRHLTGRIGELYAAMITRGQMALDVNQQGYDVVSAEGQHITVKTITSSNHAHFNKNTLHKADYVMILRVNVSEGEASIEELFRGTMEELAPLCTDTGTKLQYYVSKPASGPIALDGLEITGSAQVGEWRVLQYENGSIAVETDGIRAPVAKPILRKLAEARGISPLNGAGNAMNTRQLGAAIIAADRGSSANRFAWNDGDVVMRDEDGNEITPRQAKELQLERLRSEVEEDPPADELP